MKTHDEIYKSAMSIAKQRLGSRDKPSCMAPAYKGVEPWEADHTRMEIQSMLGLTSGGNACPDAMEVPSSHIARVVAETAVKNKEATK
jgi:hypothetical protein